jgi:DNA ligase-associated metallophosphoesterase
MTVSIVNEDLALFPERALFWKAKEILMIADLHFGKINHFRKAGIPVPTKANDKNLEVLLFLIQSVQPKRVIFLGDLFHSHYNEEWEMVREFIRSFPEISFELVIGNHDILSENQYKRSNLKLHFETLIDDPFILSHHPLENIPPDLYNLAGHIHPGVQLLGKGKQAVMLPCFYFTERQGILPAFGSFTGLARIRPKKNDQIYALVDNSVLKI